MLDIASIRNVSCDPANRKSPAPGMSLLPMAWSTRPATKEIYPARVFDSLVDDGKGRKLDAETLITAQAESGTLSAD